MAAARTPKLQDIVECPICLETLTEPRMFSCFHFYCQKCIDDMKEAQLGKMIGYECPLCRKFTAKDSLKSLPLVNNILAAISTSNDKTPKCGSCDAKATAWRCLECIENYCDTCRQNHDTLKVLRGHSFEAVSKAPKPVINDVIYCETHSTEPVTHQCRDCKQMICLVCSERMHKQHTAETIEEALQQILPEVRENQVKVKVKIETIKANIADVKKTETATKDMYEGVRKDVKADYDDVIAKLNDNLAILSNQIDAAEAKALAEVDCKVTELEFKLQSQENILTLSQSTLDTAQHASLLTTLQSEVLDSLSVSLEGADVAVPEVKAPPMEYAKCAVASENLLGKIYEGREVHKKQSEQQQMPYSDLIGKDIQRCAELKITCSRFNIIKGELWYVNEGGASISVYSLDGVKQEVICVAPASIISTKSYSIVEFNNQALVATYAGLFSVTTGPEHYANTVIYGSQMICDVAVLRNDVYILTRNSQSCKEVVDIYRYCSRRNLYHRQRGIQLNDDGRFHIEANTIEVTSHYVFVARYHGDVIQQYNNMTGELLKEYGKPGGGLRELSGPVLCGRDKNEHILVTNSGCKRLDVMKTKGIFYTLPVNVTGGFPACARVYNDKLYVAFPDSGIVRVFSIKHDSNTARSGNTRLY